MDDFNLNSIEELYIRLLPAFNTKKVELEKMGLNISESELWNYCRNTMWSKSRNLSLASMVSDILNVEEAKVINYLKIKHERDEQNDN